MLATGPAHAVTTVRVLALSDREWRVSDMGPDSCMLFVGTVCRLENLFEVTQADLPLERSYVGTIAGALDRLCPSKSSWEMVGQRHERKFRDYF